MVLYYVQFILYPRGGTELSWLEGLLWGMPVLKVPGVISSVDYNWLLGTVSSNLPSAGSYWRNWCSLTSYSNYLFAIVTYLAAYRQAYDFLRPKSKLIFNVGWFGTFLWYFRIT